MATLETQRTIALPAQGARAAVGRRRERKLVRFIVACDLLALVLAASLALFTRRPTIAGGIVWSVAIWTIPEGFGGSFLAGATDIGTAIMYALVFVVLYSLETLPTATGAWSLDHIIERRLRAWTLIAEPGGRPSTQALHRVSQT